MVENCDPTDRTSLQVKLAGETARCHWREIERFFAQGKVYLLASGLDLVATAAAIAQDDTSVIKPLVQSGDFAVPANDMARRWHDSNTELWTLVVAPFVLVQEIH